MKIKISTVLALVLIGGLVMPIQQANSTTPKPTLAQIEAAKKAEAAKKKIATDAMKRLEKARGNLKALSAIASDARAKYLRAQGELVAATKKSNAAEASYKEAAASVSSTHREIGKLAIHAYTSGGGLSDLESVLSANGPQDMMDRLSTIENLGVRNKTTLTRFKAAEVVAQNAKVVADAAKEEQRVVTEKVAAAKKVADDAQAEQQKEVDKLQAVQDKLQRDLASAKKVRVTLEQRRQLALLEEARAREATQATGQSRVWRAGGPTGVSSSRTTEAMRLKAVEFAKRQVLAGKPYVWGDEGPNSFDCSGLVYAAYRSAGLGWPNWDRLNSALYYRYVKQIPLAEMEPGDLLFYSYDGSTSKIHHITIYAGNEMMWEARSTKSGLKYSNIYSMPGLMPYAGRV
jgi:cell wall-associated NlpC family hydrolase